MFGSVGTGCVLALATRMLRHVGCVLAMVGASSEHSGAPSVGRIGANASMSAATARVTGKLTATSGVTVTPAAATRTVIVTEGNL